jgi:serine/threonine protein phosphatase PrpC
MIVHAASRSGSTAPGQDRWITTEHSVIVLDGASAFDESAPPADDYVDALLHALAARIDSAAVLQDVLAAAINQAAREVGAETGSGPSSTVALLRENGPTIEVAVLGDTTIVIGHTAGTHERLTDDRLSRIAVDERQRYRRRLRTGAGYDEHHRATLGAIQTAERAARNRNAGYWIAEADPGAADRMIIRQCPRDTVAWCVLATDGAQRGFDHLGIAWADLAAVSATELQRHLDNLHRWEAEADPDGALLPRAKRHDDKTIVVWQPR